MEWLSYHQANPTITLANFTAYESMGFKCPSYGGYTGPQLLCCGAVTVKKINCGVSKLAHALLIDATNAIKNDESKCENQLDLVALTFSC